jgi:titin
MLGSVHLSWVDNAANETSFVVERRNGNGTFAPIASLPADSVAYQDTTIQPGNTYVYRVYALNSAGPSGYSNEVTVVLPPAPLAPTDLVLTVQGSLTTGPRIRLVFRDNQNNTNRETGFQLFRSENGGAFNLLTTLAPRNNTGNVTYFDYAVLAGQTYSYYVVTINAVAASAPSNTATATVPAAPAAPIAFQASTTLTNRNTLVRIDLTWTYDFANNVVSRFVVQRATDPNFTSNLVTVNVGANNTSLTQTRMPRNTTYYYRIQAQNTFGASEWVYLTVTTP